MAAKSIGSEEYLKRFKEKFGGTISPNMEEYINTQIPMSFTCNICGCVFKRMPHNCLKSNGCPQCNKITNVKLTTEEFIERAKAIHGDKYDYSESVYEHSDDKVKVICHEKDIFGDEHGAFWVTPHAHIGSMQSGCPKCSKKFKKDTAAFIKEAKLIHGDKYDYSNVVYTNALAKVEIICKEHGPFSIKANDHLNGKGCKKCGYKVVSEKLTMTTEEFIEKARQIHGNKYDYSQVEYINSNSKVKILCPIHGMFEQSPVNHMRGKGCRLCRQSKLEIEIKQLLDANQIEYIYQHKPSWLRLQSLDFYLPKLNIGIECQGLQHFQPVDIFGGQSGYEITSKRDTLKKQLCEENGVNLLYYSNLGIDYPYHVFENKEELLEEILKP